MRQRWKFSKLESQRGLHAIHLFLSFSFFLLSGLSSWNMFCSKMAAWLSMEPRISIVYSSDLKRAYETAETIARNCGGLEVWSHCYFAWLEFDSNPLMLQTFYPPYSSCNFLNKIRSYYVLPMRNLYMLLLVNQFHLVLFALFPPLQKLLPEILIRFFKCLLPFSFINHIFCELVAVGYCSLSCSISSSCCLIWVSGNWKGVVILLYVVVVFLLLWNSRI